MVDSLFMSSGDVSSLVAYLGQAFALGVGVGVCTFALGYGVWFVMDMLRGGF